MLAAIAGIGGVILGAGLSALSARARRRRVEREDARSAARLLLPELIQNERSLGCAITFERWVDVCFEIDRWRLHEAAIARALANDWADVAAIYTAFMLMGKDREIAESDDEMEFDGDFVEYMLLTLERLRAVVSRLQDLAEIRDGEEIRIPEFYGV
jgi:hypothetical protein